MIDFYSTFCDKLKSFKNIKTSYCLNDSGDIMIRIKPKKSYVKKTLKDIKKSNHLLFLGDEDSEEEKANRFKDEITDA